MAKNIRKLLSVCMVLCMLIGVLPLQALAAEDGTTTEIVDGVEITTTQTTEITTDGENTTVTVTIEQTSEGTQASTGKEVTGTETSVTSTTTDAEGNEVGSEWSVDGYEKTKWTEKDSGDGEQTEVSANIALNADGTGKGTVESEETITNEDGSVTTTTTDRTVTTTTTDVNVTVSDTNTGIIDGNGPQLTPVGPTYDEFNGQVEDKVGVNDHLFDALIFTQIPSDWEVVDGGEYRFVGYGEDCKYSIATVEVYYEKDENGNTRYDSEGNPIIKDIRTVSGTNVTINGEDAFSLEGKHQLSPYNGTVPATLQFMDKNGNKVYAYCCDEDTPTVGGAWYTVANLEDSDYYASKEAEKHIRAIALNGYWGSSDIPKSDGSYETGSLEKLKQDLKNAIAAGNLDPMYEMNCFTENGKLLYGEDGQPVTKMVNMLDIIDGLTAGEALSATQAAIWSYSNGHQNALNGVDGTVVVAPDYRANHKSTQSDSLDDFGGARIAFLYDWLMNLETENKSTTVINEKNFLEDANLVVGDQVAGHADNQDTNEDNNVYNTSMNFTLAFSVGENDDLTIYLMDEHGSVMKDKDGNDIIKHLAPKGAVAADGYICPAADGSYTLTGLQLSENEDFTFDLRLEGTQYLEQGVYLYQPIGSRTTSQTAVGVAEGTREVDVSCAMTIKFDVDENNHVVAERVWHDENDPVEEPTTPDEEEEEEEEEVVEEEEVTPPENYRVVINDDGLEEIPDEPVPLASAPKTGDNSGLWILLVMAAAFGIVALNIFTKKRNTTSI